MVEIEGLHLYLCYRIYVLSRVCRIILINYRYMLYLRQLEYMFLN